MDFRKVGTNLVSVGHVDGGAHSNRQVVRQIHGDVASGRFQHGIVTDSARGDEFRNDTASAGFGAGRGNSVEFDAAAAGFGANRALSRAEANTSATGFNFGRTRDVPEID